MNLENKIIVVTGGSGLLGSEIVKKITSSKGQAINFDINIGTNIDKGEVNVDLEDDNSIEEAVQTVIKNFGRIDGLVNCAYPRTSDWNQNFNLSAQDNVHCISYFIFFAYIFASLVS